MTEEEDKTLLKEYTVVLFYRYAHLANPLEFIEFVGSLCRNNEGTSTILGRILVAKEGLNGTLAAFRKDYLESLIQEIAINYPQFSSVDWKYSTGQGAALPFSDLHIKHVRQLIGSGLKGKCVDEMMYFDEDSYGGISENCTGKHLSPRDFHDALIAENQGGKAPIIIDVRNKFEYEIGHFQCARTLGTNTYSESFDAMQKMLVDDVEADRRRSIYMYCTGGIRCEKASIFMKSKGFENVYQLEGGIHRYLEDINTEESLFQGKNFVFDSRVSLSNQGGGVNPSSCHPIHEKLKGESDCVHADDNTKIVGKCIECYVSHDSFSGLVVCTVCRVPVLVCSACVERLVEFHCERHQCLKRVYFSILNRFNIEELEVQCNALRQMESELLLLGKGGKNRRRTLRRQITKIEKEIVNRNRGSDEVQGEFLSESESNHSSLISNYDDSDGSKKNLDLLLQNPKTLINKTGFFWTS